MFPNEMSVLVFAQSLLLRNEQRGQLQTSHFVRGSSSQSQNRVQFFILVRTSDPFSFMFIYIHVIFYLCFILNFHFIIYFILFFGFLFQVIKYKLSLSPSFKTQFLICSNPFGPFPPFKLLSPSLEKSNFNPSHSLGPLTCKPKHTQSLIWPNKSKPPAHMHPPYLGQLLGTHTPTLCLTLHPKLAYPYSVSPSLSVILSDCYLSTIISLFLLYIRSIISSHLIKNPSISFRTFKCQLSLSIIAKIYTMILMI